MVLASFVGAPLSAIFVLACTMQWARVQHDERIFDAALLLLVLLPIVSVIKLATRRIRPDTLYVKNMRFKTYSFPSGHAYGSLLAFGFLAFISQSWLIAAGLMALIVMVGVSRVYLGAHFPSDVLGGWLMSGVILGLVIKLVAN